MKRYHEETIHTRRRHQLHLRRAHNWPTEPVHCICELQAGRFRKRHALGCLKRNCICKRDMPPRKADLIEKVRLREEADSA